MGRLKTIIKFLLYIIFFSLFILYWANKSQTGKLAKIIVVLIGLFLIPFWTITIYAILTPSKATKAPEEQIVQESPQPTPTVELSPSPVKSPSPVEKETFKVTRVIDGDTIEIEGGDRVRDIGIDAAETGCFAEEATAKNKELVEGKEVRLEKDVSETDKYGRLLRYVYVNDIFVNDYLVRNGYAQISTYPPDVKYQDQFKQAEQEARKNNRGLWAPGVCLIPTPVVKSAPSPPPEQIQLPPPQTGGYICNCSKTCPQMSSCEEAYFQLNTCGCSIRDGDNDGVPCESICPGG